METAGPLPWVGRLLERSEAEAAVEDWCAGGATAALPVATRRLCCWWWWWCSGTATACRRTTGTGTATPPPPPPPRILIPGASCAGRAMSRWSARLRAAMWPEGGEDTLEE